MGSRRTALIVTSEYSRGARFMSEALGRAGFAVSQSTLERVAQGLDAADVLVDRCLPPYDLPITTWRGHWWNNPNRSWAAWSKIGTALVSHERALPHPKTVAFESLGGLTLDPNSEYVSVRERATAILDMLGGRAVVKPDRGMMGEGVCLVDSVDAAVAAMSGLRTGVAQEYVPSASTTLRIMCARGQAVAAVARVAAPGDWRGNVAAGASLEPREVLAGDPACALAVDATSALGLDFAGVDIVDTPSGPLFLEANPAFGWNEEVNLLFPHALDQMVCALDKPTCSCGATSPHDAWACE